MHFIAFSLTLLFLFPIFSYGQKSETNTGVSDYFGGVVDFGNEKDDAYPYAYYREHAKATQLTDTAHYYEALTVYDVLQKTYGKTIDSVIGRADVYYHLGDYKTARRLFEKSMEFENFQKHRRWAFVHYRIGCIAYQEKNESEFVSFFSSIIKRDKSDDVSIRSIALSQGLDAAMVYFKIPPSYAYEAYREMGLYLLLMGEEQKEEGLMYALTALAMVVQWGIRDVLQTYDMAFAFTDLRYFFEQLIQNPKGRSFLQEAEVGRIMYTLKRYFASSHTNAHANTARIPLSNSRYIQMLLVLLDNKSVFSTADGAESKAYYPIIRL